MKLYILLPMYNASSTIARAIKSVFPYLNTYIHLMIVNDGSNDDSIDQIRDFIDHPSVHYVYQDNQGLSSALATGINKILEIEKNPDDVYVARLDSDDVYVGDGVKNIYKTIQNNPGHQSYIFGLLTKDGDPLTQRYVDSGHYTGEYLENHTVASYIDSVSSVIQLSMYNNKKYSFSSVPPRGGDGIPAMRIQRDYGAFISKLYTYIVYFTNNSLSRGLLHPSKAKDGIEINTILITEFYQGDSNNKKKYGDLCLILARNYAMIYQYKKSLHYLFQGIKHSPTNIPAAIVATVCLIPGGYHIINILIKHIYRKNE